MPQKIINYTIDFILKEIRPCARAYARGLKILKIKNNSPSCWMNYTNIRQRTKQFESVTGLTVEEFDQLLLVFSGKWRNFYRIHTIEGKKRKVPMMKADKPTKSLPLTEQKLFFILVYLKNYSLQEMLSASFGFSQSQASKWKKILCPLLFDTLDALKMLPLRDGHRVAQVLEKLGETKCFQDASERIIDRPKDQHTQQAFFSGKKKRIP